MAQGWDEINRKNGTFSIKGNFRTKQDLIPDLRLISRLWFEYERSCATMFEDTVDFAKYIQNPDRLQVYADQRVKLYACYLAAKFTEDDVVWLSKSEHLSFDPVLEALEQRVV